MEPRVMKSIIASMMLNQSEYDISAEEVLGPVRPRAVVTVFKVKRFKQLLSKAQIISLGLIIFLGL